MRIAVVHSFYSRSSPSGENEVVEAQLEVLRNSGHEVMLIALETDELSRSMVYKFNTAMNVALGIGRSPLGELQRFQPDVTIVHNLHPNFGTRWLTQWNGPIVRVIHNFRLFCANGIFFRDGSPCQICVTKNPLQGLEHACYKNSRLATFPLTIAQIRRSFRPSELDGAYLYIALSESAKSHLIMAGLNPSQIQVVPNFVNDNFEDSQLTSRTSHRKFIAVGRLEPEKGFLELVQRWPAGVELDIVGSGSLMNELSEAVSSRSEIRLLGRMDRLVLLSSLPDYLGAVVPSLCYEVAPMTALEFMSAGLPIITTQVNASAELVNISKSGVVITSIDRNQLIAAINEISEFRLEMSINARALYKSNFTPEVWEAQLLTILKEL
jgi:glycosyltransferase involved in cell wall biosynthesis